MNPEKQEVETALTTFASSLSKLEKVVQPVLSALDELRSSKNEDDLDAMSRARVHISLTYTVNSLFCMYLRTQGIDPEAHPVAHEITRVQEAFMRMRKVEAGQSAEFQPPPNRDRRKHIVNTKKSEAALSALVFPEESDLVRALLNKKKFHRKDGEGSDGADNGDDDENSTQDDDGLAHIRATEEELEAFKELAARKDFKTAIREDKRKAKGLKVARKLQKKKKKKY